MASVDVDAHRTWLETRLWKQSDFTECKNEALEKGSLRRPKSIHFLRNLCDDLATLRLMIVSNTCG